MGEDKGPYQEGKRAGLHPLVVVFGVLLGLWLFVALLGVARAWNDTMPFGTVLALGAVAYLIVQAGVCAEKH